MVVEDNRVTSTEICQKLEEFGYTVIGAAASGEEALSILSKNLPDVILMDIEIEGHMDGIDLTSRIKNEYKDMPIVYLSDKSDDKTIYRASGLSDALFLSKPITNYGILDMNLKRLLGKDKEESKEIDLVEYHPGYVMVTKPNKVKERIDFEQVTYLKADSQYCNVYNGEEEIYKFSKNLNSVLELINSKKFIRVHRSYAINVDALVKMEDSDLILKGVKDPVPTSPKQLKELKKLVPMI